MKYCCLPARGELGLRILYHVPSVYALDGPKVVYHEKGEEALYPNATRLIELPRIEDDKRAGTHPRTDAEFVDRYRRFARQRWPDAEVIQTDPSMPQERFVPEPHVPQLPDPKESVVDVVVCPRWRDYGAQKNWGGWPKLVANLERRGIRTWAAGAPDSSIEVPCERAWEYDRCLDASIEMIRRARFVVATDAGLAHLAVLCGADLLVITYRGLIAPGPVVDSSGTVADDSYQRAGWDRHERENRLEAANHMGARIEYVDGWDSVGEVTRAVEEW